MDRQEFVELRVFNVSSFLAISHLKIGSHLLLYFLRSFVCFQLLKVMPNQKFEPNNLKVELFLLKN